MIRFPCNCGNEIAVPESMAGDVTQCTRCGRLWDVPHLDELDKIDADGSFKLTADEAPTKGGLDEVPGRGVVLEYRGGKNRGVDRRNSVEQFLAAGVTEDPDIVDLGPHEAPHEQRRPKQRLRKPKYDPETGELVSPVEIAERAAEAQKVVPVEDEKPGDSKTLGYADWSTMSRTSLVRLPMDLLQPHNLFVLMIMATAHVLLGGYFALPLVFMLITSLAGFLLLIGVMGHYGNVIEDTGPEQRDDIPTLFRHASFSEDIWTPFVRVAAALLICFWPIIIVQAVWLYERASGIMAPAGTPPALLQPAVVIGAAAYCAVMIFTLPALLLILCTSGSAANLAPLRVLRTMIGGGLGYIWSLMLLAAAILVIVGSGVAFRTTMKLLLDQIPPLPVPTWVFVVGGLAGTFLGVYLLHLACFSLGMVYRKHHGDFRWAYQHFEKGDRDDAMSKLERFHKRRAARKRAATQAPLADPNARNEARLAMIRAADRANAEKAHRRAAGLPVKG